MVEVKGPQGKGWEEVSCVKQTKERPTADGIGPPRKYLSGADRRYLGGAEEATSGRQIGGNHRLSPRAANHTAAGRAGGLLLGDDRRRRRDFPDRDSERRRVIYGGTQPKAFNVRGYARDRRSHAGHAAFPGSYRCWQRGDRLLHSPRGRGGELSKAGDDRCRAWRGFPPLSELAQKVRDF